MIEHPHCHRARLPRLLLLAALTCFAVGCQRPAAESESAPQKAANTAPEQETQVPAKTPEQETETPEQTPAAQANRTLVGKVVKKPWTKSVESWNAGGSEYYVLEIETATDVDLAGTTILRASDTVPFETFEQFVDARVQVTGTVVEPEPYEPRSAMEQYPTGMDGKPVPRGGGFSVVTIEAAP